ncbi:hypothetical protein OROHE_023480 [Orobanche hederae]
MGDGNRFVIYLYHGGNFRRIGGARFYSGGTYQRNEGFDLDRLRYFDVVGVVENLGYEKWNCIAYNIPKNGIVLFIDLEDDNDVITMVRNLSNECRCISMYVDGGLRKVTDTERG